MASVRNVHHRRGREDSTVTINNPSFKKKDVDVFWNGCDCPCKSKPVQVFVFSESRTQNCEDPLCWAIFRSNQLKKRSVFLLCDLEFFPSENRCRNGAVYVQCINIIYFLRAFFSLSDTCFYSKLFHCQLNANFTCILCCKEVLIH